MLPKILENRNGELYIDHVSALELAKKFDTPLYVISETRIRENCRSIYDTFVRNYEKIRIYYSAKANTNISVLRIMEREGVCLDAVSPGEVFLAKKAGFSPEKILFTGTSVRDDELEYLLNSNVVINVDSLSQLNRLLKKATPDLLSVRINPEVGAGHHGHVITAGKDSKFGVWDNEAVKTYKKARKAGVDRFGIHMHIGSGILDARPLIMATEKLLNIAKKVRDKVNVDFEFLNIGGGLGVPYRPVEKELDLKQLSNSLLSLFRKKIKEYDLGEPVFCLEPGRYIVCDAGILLTAVNTIKITPFKKFVGVDAGFNTLIRPTMYGSYHQILVATKLDLPNVCTYDVAGPICESGDILAKGRELPEVREGDLLAVLNAGAYGYSMSSQYNSRPRAAEVLVKEGNFELVRERETIDGLIIGQKIAAWLK